MSYTVRLEIEMWEFLGEEQKSIWLTIGGHADMVEAGLEEGLAPASTLAQIKQAQRLAEDTISMGHVTTFRLQNYSLFPSRDIVNKALEIFHDGVRLPTLTMDLTEENKKVTTVSLIEDSLWLDDMSEASPRVMSVLYNTKLDSMIEYHNEKGYTVLE